MLRNEAMRHAAMLQCVSEGAGATFLHFMASAADEKITGGMLMGVRTPNKSIQAVDAVDQPMFKQKIKAAIDGRRFGAAIGGFKLVE